MVDASTILNGYGLAGLVIFVLATVVVVLYRDNQSLQKKLEDSQEARVNDQKENKQNIAVPLEIQGKVMDLIYRKLYDAKKDA
jgi:hypothetical protein